MTPNQDKVIRLAALRKSISEMSDEELRNKIKETRNNRRKPVEKPKRGKAKSTARPKKKKELSLADIDKMSPEEAAAFLSKLTSNQDLSDA